MTAHYYQDERATLWHGDCLDVMAALPAGSVDAIVTDPPYGLGFMGKAWDDLPPGLPWARECLRVLKPGGHLLAFGGTRTWHRLACAVEDAGFEMRDSIAWLYGSGFPKSLDVSKAIDKAAGAEREVVGRYTRPDGSAPRDNVIATKYSGTAYNGGQPGGDGNDGVLTAPATPDAERWQGWGTALKPAFEPIVVARKPLAGTVASNALAWGTGALNIDGCRVPTTDNMYRPASDAGDRNKTLMAHDGTHGSDSRADSMFRFSPESHGNPSGRWPANVVLDEDQAAVLDEMSGALHSRLRGEHNNKARSDGEVYGEIGRAAYNPGSTYGDSGGASRFFYTAKAPGAERPRVDGVAHPTVKPLDLMRWLVRLVTPPGGLVLDPFAGSGTTGEAAIMEGFRVWLVEREADYLPLILHRIERAQVPLDFTEGTVA